MRIDPIFYPERVRRYLELLADSCTTNDTIQEDPEITLGDMVDHNYETAYRKGYATGETNLARLLLGLVPWEDDNA